MQNEFFGMTEMKSELDEDNNSCFDWKVTNPEMTVRGTREIEDGDYLEVMDNLGTPLLRKRIYRDYNTYYNKEHRRQLHQGMAIKWAPKGIALDFWINLFANHYRARLIKSDEE